tara:strand:+ start:364 stop:660 length:297 start_codon:yes stop_codon:yes gene_type:complete
MAKTNLIVGKNKKKVVKSGGRQVKATKTVEQKIDASNLSENVTKVLTKNQVIRMKKKEALLAQQKDERKNLKKVPSNRLPAELSSLRDNWVAVSAYVD